MAGHGVVRGRVIEGFLGCVVIILFRDDLGLRYAVVMVSCCVLLCLWWSLWFYRSLNNRAFKISWFCLRGQKTFFWTKFGYFARLRVNILFSKIPIKQYILSLGISTRPILFKLRWLTPLLYVEAVHLSEKMILF